MSAKFINVENRTITSMIKSLIKEILFQWSQLQDHPE
jgi:hypothetical protein